jgi:transcriptional regulator with XRE-family HTH domain
MQIWRSGFNQSRLARVLGIHETVLSKIVNGFRKPSAAVRARMAAVLQRDEDWLFQWEDAPPSGFEAELAGQPPAAPPASLETVAASDSGIPR